MSCYGCLKSFSLFTKEHSCPNCELSYCSKCLKQKGVIDNEEKNICKNCYKKLTSTSDTMTSPDSDTPDLLLKRLETLENPAKPPITIFRHSNRLNNLKNGLSSEDKKILERLEKLKADRTPSILPDENEIKRRLAILQGRNEESIAKKAQSLESPKKSQQEQVEDLLKQYMEETGIEGDLEMTGRKNIEDIEGRLTKLKMSESSAMAIDPTNQEDEDEDEDAATLRIVKRAIAEGQLERKLRDSMSKGEDSDISDISDEEPEKEEFPWCIICNEDATIRCFGCDGSLYCNSCFKQGHEFFNMEEHNTVPYAKKNSLSD